MVTTGVINQAARPGTSVPPADGFVRTAMAVGRGSEAASPGCNLARPRPYSLAGELCVQGSCREKSDGPKGEA
jgi:hypothetical protein